MSTDGSIHSTFTTHGQLVVTYLSWYIACFQSGNS
jgi:hypothetical protein